MISEAATIASLRGQIADATNKMRQHLKERIATTKNQIASSEPHRRTRKRR